MKLSATTERRPQIFEQENLRTLLDSLKEDRERKRRQKGEKRGLVSLTSFAGELEAALHWEKKATSAGG